MNLLVRIEKGVILVIFSTLEINDSDPIYIQLERHIIDGIKKGDLKKDSKLPSTREVSNYLKISRNSVISAYENLESKGYILTKRGKGTFIAVEGEKQVYEYNVEWDNLVNKYGKVLREKDIIKSEPKFKRGMISFKSIAPESELFNLEDFKRALMYQPLIDYLFEYMEEKGVSKENKDILITNGFTEGFDIILASLTSPGDVILCEEPTNNTALKVMEAYGLKVVGVPMDKDGMVIEDLNKTLQLYSPKLAYLIPSYNNPTGIVMNSERRKEIYKIFREHSIPIIENGFNEELLYSSSPLEPLAALSGRGNGVVYIGSLSKVLFPGLRIGWIMGDKKLIDILESVKRGRTIHSSFLDQSAFYYYLKSGAFTRYIKNIRKYYRNKYNLIMEMVNKHIPYEYVTGEGGLYVFIKLKNNISSRELLNLCYEDGVLFMPGDLFYNNFKGESSLRLGFGRVSDDDIRIGIEIIGKNIEVLMKQKGL